MSDLDRRGFLKQSALGMTAATAATLLGETQAAKAEASERVRVGCVGTGGRAGFLVRAFAANPEVDVVALADLDPRRLAAGVQAVKDITGKAPAAEKDFRHLVDDNSLDALVVGTPDHWHAIPTIMGCLAGKDVYVEKPDSHNIVEGRTMVAAMKKHKRVVQMGTQARTSEHFQGAVDYARSGALGRVLVAKAWESSRQGSLGHPADTDPPEGVDYDFWLGPAPKRPFNPMRFHGNWRWFFDYGTGDLGNDGVHRLDYARWALSAAGEAQGEKPLYMPTKISAVGGKWYFDDIQEWPDTLQVNYEYPGDAGKPGKILTYEMRVWVPYDYNGEGEGAILYGDKGYLIIGNDRWRAYNPDGEIVAQGSGGNDGTTHIQNFVDCIKSRRREDLIADVEQGHYSAMLCHLGNIAYRTGRRLEFDGESETFPHDPAANQLLAREYRQGFELPKI